MKPNGKATSSPAPSKGPPATPPKKKAKKTKASFLGLGDVVTFYVGGDSERRTFIVHKSFACHYSPVLKAAFNGSLMEGQTQSYRLEDTPESVFGLFAQWLYAQNIGQDFPDEVAETATIAEAKVSDLAELWVLSDRLIIPSLQNLALDKIGQIFKRQEKGTVAAAIRITKYAHESTGVDSQLRRRLLDWWAWECNSITFSKYSTELPQQMVFDVAKVLKSSMKGIKSGNYSIARPCNSYHVPDDTEDGSSKPSEPSHSSSTGEVTST